MASGASDPLGSVWWFWRDWRASGARAMMSTLARGIYRELLDAHYMAEDCSLPGDDKSLAALAGVTAREWSKVKAEVLPWIPERPDGRRQNARAFAEWERAMVDREVKRERARQGGLSKAQAERERAKGLLKQAVSRPQADTKKDASTACGVLKPASSSASPSPTTSSSEQISSPAAPQAPDGAGGYALNPALEPQTGQPAGRSPRHGHPTLPRSAHKRPALDVAPVIEAWNRIAAETGLPTVRGGGKIDDKVRPMLREEPDVLVIERAMRIFAAIPFIREQRYSLGNFLCNREKYLPRAQAGDDDGSASAAENPFLSHVE